MLTFIAASLIVELTPGPNMTWLAVTGVARGRRAALAAVAGIALGLAFAGVVAGVGLSTLIAATPWLFTALRWAGAIYLLYLAYDAWRKTGGRVELQRDAPLGRFFLQGLVGNVLNPKAYLFYAAILPQFLDPEAQVASQVALFTIVFVAVATAVHTMIALLSGTLAPWLEGSLHAHLVRRALAVAIAATAVWFLYATRIAP